MLVEGLHELLRVEAGRLDTGVLKLLSGIPPEGLLILLEGLLPILQLGLGFIFGLGGKGLGLQLGGRLGLGLQLGGRLGLLGLQFGGKLGLFGLQLGGKLGILGLQLGGKLGLLGLQLGGRLGLWVGEGLQLPPCSISSDMKSAALMCRSCAIFSSLCWRCSGVRLSSLGQPANTNKYKSLLMHKIHLELQNLYNSTN